MRDPTPPPLEIHTHPDASVTLRCAGIVAHVSGPSWRDANEAAHALGTWLVTRADLAATRRKLSTIGDTLCAVQDSLDVAMAELDRLERDHG